MKNTIFSKVLAEFIGSFFLVLTVVGSGIMGENLSDNLALTLLGNSIATGAILFVIITMFINISGAYFNPAVVISDLINGKLNIGLSKIKSNSKIINKGKVNLEFQNGNIIIRKADLNINKIGSMNVSGKISKQKKSRIINFKTKVNIKKQKIFYLRFLIPENARKEISTAQASGRINLNNFELNFDEIKYRDNYKLKQSELKNLVKKINSFVSKNRSIKLLNKSNFSFLVRIFFD